MREGFPRGELLLACALALALRLIYLAGVTKSPLFLHPQLDSAAFDASAWDIARGDLSHVSASGTSPYSWFLAAIYGVAGHNPLGPRVAQAVLDVGSVVLLSATAFVLWGRRAASLTADVAAVYGPLIFFVGELHPASFSFFLVAAFLFLTVRSATAGSRWGVLAAGLGLAFASAFAIHGWDGVAVIAGGSSGVGSVHTPHDVRGFFENLVLAWNRCEMPCGADQAFFAAFNSPLFRLPWLLSFAIVGPIALVTVWLEGRRAPLLAGYLIAFTAVVAMAGVCDRTRLPVLAAAIPFAGAGIDRLWKVISNFGTEGGLPKGASGGLRGLVRLARANASVLIAVAVAAVLVNLPLPVHRRATPGAGWALLAQGYEAAGDSRAALRAYASAERDGLKTPDFYTRWGTLEWREHSGIQAEQHFLLAINADPGYAAAHEALAGVYFERGTYEQAGLEFANAADLIPSRAAELHTRAGEAYEEWGNRDRAAAMFERALRERPGFRPAEAGLERLQQGGIARERVKMFPPLGP